MENKIRGKIIAVLETKSGTSASGDWSVQSWVLEEQEGQYPKKISFEAMNKHFDLKVGQDITAHINLESREWQGKWFLSAKAWKIDFNGAQQPTAPLPPAPAAEIPPAPAKTETKTETKAEDAPPIETDDLPF